MIYSVWTLYQLATNNAITEQRLILVVLVGVKDWS